MFCGYIDHDQSHPSLSSEERSRICGCLNYEKLSLEVCKELAKKPRIPPGIAVQALISQQSKIGTKELVYGSILSEEKEDMTVNLERMQWRVVELEQVCREMKGQMSRLVRHNVLTNVPGHTRSLPRLC
jgi:hypothetical protein